MGVRLRIGWVLLLLLTANLFGVVAPQRLFRLMGKVVQSDGKPFQAARPVVFLQGAVTPFSVHVTADKEGRFEFKELRPGTYTLIIGVALHGEMVKTIEIGASVADPKGKVSVTITFEQQRHRRDATISTTQLSVSEQAKTEYYKAQDRLGKHDTASAVSHLKKAVALSPQFAGAWNNLGTIAYQSRNYAEAERCFRQALKQDPAAYAPLVNLGGALLSLGKADAALGYNMRAVGDSPSDALAHSQLGQNYFVLGQLYLAEAELKKAKTLDPGHFSAPQLVLADIYARTERPASAIQEVEEFLRLHPDTDRAPKLRQLLDELRKATVP